MNDLTQKILSALIGIVVALMLIELTEAHPPCDATPPQCSYVQVVNPYTGQLETEYVCK